MNLLGLLVGVLRALEVPLWFGRRTEKKLSNEAASDIRVYSKHNEERIVNDYGLFFPSV